MFNKSNPSPYLSNEYTPVSINKTTKEWLNITILEGEIPKALNGYFLRNSSNPQFKPGNKYHWFDGDGMIQGIKFNNGKAYFKATFITTKKITKEQKQNKSLFGGLKGPINSNNIFFSLKRLFSFIFLGHNPFPNTSNTDLVFHHNTLLSLWMLCGTAYKIDLESLNTTSSYNFSSKENGFKGVKHGISAHPKTSPKDDTLFVMDFVNSWKRFTKPSIYLSSVSSDNSVINTKNIPISGRHLLHDIAVTENYVIIIDMPATMTPLGLKYKNKKPSRFGIVPCSFKQIEHPITKTEEDVIWFDDPSGCYIIHIVNAYEEGNNIVLYALRKPYLELNKKLSNEVTDVFDGYLHKWVFNLKTGKIENKTGESLTHYFPIGAEFPSINENYEGRHNTFSYLPGISRTPQFNFNSFSKYNHQSNTYITHSFPKGVYNGEIRFVPHPEANNDEDHGWLLTYVTDTRKESNNCFLYIFDAKDITVPICILQIPLNIPIGFHTTWVASQN